MLQLYTLRQWSPQVDGPLSPVQLYHCIPLENDGNKLPDGIGGWFCFASISGQLRPSLSLYRVLQIYIFMYVIHMNASGTKTNSPSGSPADGKSLLWQPLDHCGVPQKLV